MPWIFSNDKPIFQQIADRLTTDTLCGKYPPGGKLPPVRDLALEAGVNPNTMQRALVAVEESGLIYSKRGDGRYITEDETVIRHIRTELAQKEINEAVSVLLALGMEPSDILLVVRNRLSEIEEDS